MYTIVYRRDGENASERKKMNLFVANFGRGRPFFEGEIRFVTNLRWEMQIFGRRAPISSPFFEEIY